MSQLPSFDKLVKEAKAFEAKRKLEKKPKKKTMGESRRSREKALTCSLVKQIVNDRNYQALQATRHPHHIHVFARREICHKCHEEQLTVQRITVVEEDRAGNHYLSSDLDINSYAMLEFQRKDLEIKFHTEDKIVPSCYTCLTEIAEQASRRQA